MPDRVTIIAEAGVNHNGDLDTARRLVDVAADAGADVVKFQTFNADQLITLSADKADYQKEHTSIDESQYAMLRRLELGKDLHVEIAFYCKSKGIQFNSTPFDKDSLDLLIELEVPFVKIPSGEITNLPHLRHVGHCRKPILLSSGMATMDEIGAALEVLEKSGAPRNQITLLHCSSAYPTPKKEVNLRAMQTLHQVFGVAVGYSDHTVGIEIPIAAVVLGATVIEKHFTLDKSLPGPDHAISLEPTELHAMVTAIRNIESALGDGSKQPTPSEIKNRAVVRRSLVATRDIRAGEVFDEYNLTAKRPGTGISPMQWNSVLGTKAARDFTKDELIEL